MGYAPGAANPLMEFFMLTFNLTEQQADIVLNALAQRPYIEVQGVIQTLMRQVLLQQNPPAQTQEQGGLGDLVGLAGREAGAAAVSLPNGAAHE